MMPKEQQEYIDLYNELEISRTIYEELESRRLGFSILEASTIGDIRVVDDAYVVSLVSPRLIYVVFISFIAFVLACIIAIIRGLNFLPLSNPAEIFDNNIREPIIGVIPEAEDITSEENIALNSSIESLIINISSIMNNQSDNKVITITSPTPFNGKSTISMKLAEGFAKIGKKVLLVDNDLKRGKIGKSYNVNSISEKSFYSIDETSINKYAINDNLHLIPRVKGLNNTFQFLYSHRYKEKMNFFKDYFDIVIFDTGPLLSVADTSILIKESDFNILIARHGVSRVNEVKQAIDNFGQINVNLDGIVYNAYAKPKSYYGYYGIYGNYAYQYYAEKYLDDNYDYEKKFSLIIAFLLINGCSLSPGMHMETKSKWLDDSKYVFIDSLDKNIKLTSISETFDMSYKNNYQYKTGVGDQIAVTIWGLPEIFPINNTNPDLNLRRVDANGNIFFHMLD